LNQTILHILFCAFIDHSLSGVCFHFAGNLKVDERSDQVTYVNSGHIVTNRLTNGSSFEVRRSRSLRRTQIWDVKT